MTHRNILSYSVAFCLLAAAPMLQAAVTYCNDGSNTADFYNTISDTGTSPPVVSTNGTQICLQTTSISGEQIIDFHVSGAAMNIAGNPLVQFDIASIDPNAFVSMNAVYFDAGNNYLGETNLAGTGGPGILSGDAAAGATGFATADSYFIRIRIGNASTPIGSTVKLNSVKLDDGVTGGGGGDPDPPAGVPEPSRALLLALGFMSVLSKRRR